MAKKHLSKRFSPALIEQFDNYCQEFDTSDACLDRLLNLAKMQQDHKDNGVVEDADSIMRVLGFSADEQALMHEGLAASVMPWMHHFKQALLTKARVLAPSYKPRTVDDIDITNPQERWHVRGAATARCRQVFDEVVAANLAATSISGKRYITRSLITDLAQCSPTIAIRFCDANAEEIAAHNTAMGFADAKQGKTHNQYRYKAEAEV